MQNSGFQDLVDTLCDKYDIDPIPIIFNHTMLTRPGVGGQYDFIRHVIIIDENENPNEYVDIVYHEFRHYWQDIFFHRIFRWWVCHSRGLYRTYYNTNFCSIEADARVYGASHGKHERRDLLQAVDPYVLEACACDRRILRRILLLFGVEEVR